jgi:hypothetical protein
MVSGQELTKGRSAWVRGLVLLAPLALLAGCATTETAKAPSPPPVGKPVEVMATWKPTVQVFPDTLNNGKPTPALSGRVYLFDGQMGSPIVADGMLVVSVYDDHPRVGANGDPVPLQIWKITPECMKLVQTRDVLGWGYTLNLPWDTYRPDITQVRFMVRFEPPKDAKDEFPLFQDSGLLTLQNNAGNNQSMAQVTTRYGQPSVQLTGAQALNPVQMNPGTPQAVQPNLAGAPGGTLPINNGAHQGILPVNAALPPPVGHVSNVPPPPSQGSFQPPGTSPQGTMVQVNGIQGQLQVNGVGNQGQLQQGNRVGNQGQLQPNVVANQGQFQPNAVANQGQLQGVAIYPEEQPQATRTNPQPTVQGNGVATQGQIQGNGSLPQGEGNGGYPKGTMPGSGVASQNPMPYLPVPQPPQ